MNFEGVVEGLNILGKYLDRSKHNVGAGHDVIYVYPTGELQREDLVRLVELGWFQENVGGEEFRMEDYDPGEGWSCFV